MPLIVDLSYVAYDDSYVAYDDGQRPVRALPGADYRMDQAGRIPIPLVQAELDETCRFDQGSTVRRA